MYLKVIQIVTKYHLDRTKIHSTVLSYIIQEWFSIIPTSSAMSNTLIKVNPLEISKYPTQDKYLKICFSVLL